MAAGAPTVNVGDVIGGRYRVQSWIGQGHMAVVYHATHEGTGKPCAIKLVHAHLVSRPDIVDLFLKEARIGSRIGHSPYIVDVFDSAVDETRRVPYLVMELLSGEALDHYLHTRGPMPAAMVRILYQQLGEALDQAHAAGVVHRDLKPANLFLTQDRRGGPVLKVVDFGIAKVLELEAQRTATQVGSPAYAAPEQLGQALRKLAAKNGITISGSVSGASDIWASGLIAYELLTGLVAGQFWGPFDSLGDLVTRVVLEEPMLASQRAGDRANLLPPGFDAWLTRCLAKDASQRWATAGEAAAALVKLLDGDGSTRSAMRNASSPMIEVTSEGSLPPPEPQNARPAGDGATAASGAPNEGALLNEGAHAGAPNEGSPNAGAPNGAAPNAGASNATPAIAGVAGQAMASADRARTDPPMGGPAHGAFVPASYVRNPARFPLPPPTGFSEPAPAPERSSGSVPPDTSAAGTKSQTSNERSSAAAWAFATLSILVMVAAVTFVLMPKKGHLRIDIKAEGGAPIDHAEIFVDGRKVCDTTPCLARDISPGSKMVKAVTPDGRIVGQTQEIVTSGEEKAITLVVAPTSNAPPSSAPSAVSGSIASAEPGTPAATSAAPLAAGAAGASAAPAAPTEPQAHAHSSSSSTPSTEPRDAHSASTTSTPKGASSSSAQGASGAETTEVGTLNINSIPVAKIVLDGKPMGNTPRLGVTVAPGPHTIVFIHATMGKRSVSVSVKPGETKTASTKFE